MNREPDKEYKIPDSNEFKRKVADDFHFLVKDFGFNEPEIVSSKDEYRDRLIYYKKDCAVEVLNAWHPYDYGFEVNYYSDRTLVGVINDRQKTREMVYYRIKEEQDKDLRFIEEGAVALNRFIISKRPG